MLAHFPLINSHCISVKPETNFLTKIIQMYEKKANAR